MTTYLEIAVNVPQVSGVFHYHLPPELEGSILPGCLVEVPFGRQSVQGVVLRDVAVPEVATTRPVSALLDPLPVLTPAQIALARHLAEETLSSLAAIVALMLPPGLGQQADSLYAVNSASSSGMSAQLPALQKRLLKLLEERGPLRGRQIDAAMPKLDWRPAAQALVRKEHLTAQAVLPPPRVRPKQVRTVQLACPPSQAEAALPDLGRGAALERRQAVLRYLMGASGPVDVPWVLAESGGTRQDLNYLAERDLVLFGESEIWRDPLEKVEAVAFERPILTSYQQTAWEAVQAAIAAAAAAQQPGKPLLLHGITGSGKTEIYLRAVEETLRLGRQAIVLVPEISLTPQTVRRFLSRFPGQVGLAHSQLSEGERYDTWRRARQGLISVLVGPRSALFTPFANLGLIVLDECHDSSYYQAEAPFYHTLAAARAYARLADAVCLLGSATPDVVTRWQADCGELQRLSLPQRAGTHPRATDLPPVQIVDMRTELKVGNTHLFSRALQAALSETLQKEQQAILFLNRRGSATYVFCRECGETLKCPHCDLPLAYHLLSPSQPGLRSDPAAMRLVCHHCAYSRNMPSHCPACHSPKIRHYGAGTEKVEAEVQALFPHARTLRWDYETTRQKGAHEIILGHFSARRADILIGTQMVAKGLDLPLVTLVGAVLADVGLGLPDYRAAERTFQVLTQVAGRAGRSRLGGRAILQTFQPEHYAIQAAAGHNYEGFYRQELEQRRALGYPPFGRLVRLEMRHTNAAHVEAAAQEMATQIRTWIAAEERRATEIIGPAPCFFARVGGLYRWQIVLRGPEPATLLRGKLLGGWRVEVDPVSLL